jgi:hypothetical protein
MRGSFDLNARYQDVTFAGVFHPLLVEDTAGRVATR